MNIEEITYQLHHDADVPYEIAFDFIESLPEGDITYEEALTQLKEIAELDDNFYANNH